MKRANFPFRLTLLTSVVTLLAACHSIIYQPTKTIEQIDLQRGYRLENTMQQALQKENLVIMTFSGGGSRAASLGYGVLEQFKNAMVRPTEKGDTLLQNIDVVYGVSGGSVLAAYFALEGQDVIPKFNESFLKKDFQKKVINEVFSMSNVPRLTSPQFGRSDLLQEQLNLALYKGKKFADLAQHRKGPFAVINATDMTMGQKISFTQDFFDWLCLDLNDIEIARAVAASSAVPLIFSPVTLNNHGGSCHIHSKKAMLTEQPGYWLLLNNFNAMEKRFARYQNNPEKTYLHLVDGGLTDNLGLASLLDMSNLLSMHELYTELKKSNLRNIVVVNVNAQNENTSQIDKSADVPGVKEVVNTVISVPIDKATESTLQYSQKFADQWNAYTKRKKDVKIKIYFVNLSLRNLPEGQLKTDVLHIGTSFYLPESDVDKLREAAKILLEQSKEYQEALKALQ
ncbi:patatin-like phospholipase family protein [Aggregatibacter actinomycetemcomitans]|uniref:patatin-like phospholipase family protein n=1 Tax=Aggregatibacter actinomycetemcomitans TaxID=714 RepID=UPI00197BCBFC|nr:patatin-like phospholipase family protein [Aggregatibacter actinomycetemcomitans]MBN6069811.1 patatin-like phospholipase family protein [Aggregatibacter actinomycetemcomitans]MBN6074185.1 patatin-like phospholipase family protein [Aggregatibacter actinomycetemcomitans]